MSIDSPHDPRTALVRTKYFHQYPQPLERWLWRQGLPQAAERVFWLHWTEGKRNGDWCSEIPLKRVALECCVDPSTVTRSYQLLKTRGLIRREDPGRDPSNPFCQATAITEVRLPREFITELARSPNRPLRDRIPPRPSRCPPPTAGKLRVRRLRGDAGHPTPDIPDCAGSATEPPRNARSVARASEAERARFFVASRDRLTSLEFDADTRLTAEDRGQILAQLTQLAVAKPTAATTPTPKSATGPYTGPRGSAFWISLAPAIGSWRPFRVRQPPRFCGSSLGGRARRFTTLRYPDGDQYSVEENP